MRALISVLFCADERESAFSRPFSMNSRTFTSVAVLTVSALAWTVFPSAFAAAQQSAPPSVELSDGSASTAPPTDADIEADRAAIIAALRAEDVPTEDGRNELGEIVATANALIGIPVSGERYELAKAKFDRESDTLDELNRTVAELSETLEELAAERSSLASHRLAVSKDVDELNEVVTEVTSDITTFAVSRYISDTNHESYADPRTSVEEQVTRDHSQELSRSALDNATSTLAKESSLLDKAAADLDDTTARMDENSAQATLTSLRRDRLERDRADSTSRLADAARELLLATANATVSGSDMSVVALDAYYRAADAVAITHPSCGIAWWALAGIGRTESRHGTYAGGEPGPDGLVTEPIIGIALDGTRNTAHIADTDGGVLDGDPFVDRAVGPMQFIPSTWARYAADLSGDGVADPQNIYDAALAAARYLCAGGRNMTTDEGMISGFLSYNRSQSYASLVLTRSRGYQLLGLL